MLRDGQNDKILQHLADMTPLDLDINDIHFIVDFQFKVVKDSIVEKRFVELPKLGRFYVKEGRDKHIPPEKRFYEPHVRNSNGTADDDENS